MLIVMSILLALAVAAWQEEREISQLIERSLLSFENEIRQNNNVIDALSTLHVGLLSYLQDLHEPEASNEVRNVIDTLEATALLTTAWETALATGALAEMDYETAFVLSLTYSFQRRFEALYNTQLIELSAAAANENSEELHLAASRLVRDVTTAESELLAAYQQALQRLESDGAADQATAALP